MDKNLKASRILKTLSNGDQIQRDIERSGITFATVRREPTPEEEKNEEKCADNATSLREKIG